MDTYLCLSQTKFDCKYSQLFGVLDFRFFDDVIKFTFSTSLAK